MHVMGLCLVPPGMGVRWMAIPFFKPTLSEDILTEELRDNLKGYSHVGVKINLF